MNISLKSAHVGAAYWQQIKASCIAAGMVLSVLFSTMAASAEGMSSSAKLQIDFPDGDVLTVTHAVFSVFVLPNTPLRFTSLEKEGSEANAKASDFRIDAKLPGSWHFVAPAKPGRYEFAVTDPHFSRKTVINVFVLVPYGEMKGGVLRGYRIDDYPKQPFRGLANYRRPKGFVAIDERDLEVFVSPHFQLKQFLCKQTSAYPKFVVLQSKTLLMLEDFLEYVNDSGFKIDTFGVISAYRTPYYNHAIGNVPSSRHVYGDAMDLFIDRDRDGRLDDLDGNAQRNLDDVMVLYRLAVKFQEASNGVFLGGVGKYSPTSDHGGFVHLDSRGYRARW